MNRGDVPLSLQRRVRLRAGHCCEYCGIPQAGQDFLILDKTSIGRASVELLRMNRPITVDIRQRLGQRRVVR